jgi:PKD repeat protein
MRNHYLLALLLGMMIVIPIEFLNAQVQTFQPAKIITPAFMDESKPLRDVEPIPPGVRSRSWKDNTIKNKTGFKEDFKRAPEWDGRDPVLQDRMQAIRADATVGENFAGVSNLSGVAPPDTDGDVGPNHYFQMINLSYAIYDKNGNLVHGPFDNQTIWEGFDDGQPFDNANDGDPIVLYDEQSDRWLVSQFAVSTTNNKFYELVAISTSPDPTGSYYRYAFEFDNMPDYPKFGIWPDGYYLSINQFANAQFWAGGGVAVLDKAAMLSGSPNATMIFFNLGTSYGSLLPADWDGSTAPPSGDPNVLLELTSSSLRVWEASVNWSNPNSSTISNLGPLSGVQSFSYSGISISQPGTSQKLDALSDRLMYRLQYRNFSTHQSLVTNHTVNAGGGRAGVRWYELRNTGNGWSVYQQGTYAPSDGDSRWMASVAMNGNGDIAVGYSVSGSATYPSIRVAGQTAGEPGGLGVLDVTETSIKEGTASQTGVNRWGDYSMMSVDPNDDNTFWYTTEYSSGGWNWKTQVASFTFTPPVPMPPVADFAADNTNPATGNSVSFTDLSQNNPTSWSWTFQGGTPSTSTDQHPTVNYNIEGTYDVSLTVTNDEGNDTKTVVGYISVEDNPVTYCASQGNNFSYEWISNVQFGSFNNSSGASGYTDFTGLTINMDAGENVSLSLTPDFSSTVYTEYWKVWIDYNKDGDFTDAGEEVFSDVSNTTVSGSFNVLSSASGTTRMRVSMKWNAAQTSCETFSYGEVEDYTVSFSDPPPPPPTPPVADFTADETTVTEGESVQFTDLSANNPTSWSWNFGGGTPSTSTAQNPSVTYNTAGTYNVSLTATNDDGSNTKTETAYITVNEASGGSDPVEISFTDFENGFGIWTDGGGDCRLYNRTTYAWSGSNSADIQDNSGVASSFYLTNGVDVQTPGYVQLDVEFYFIAVSMDNADEDFWLQYYDGSTWHTVADFDQGTDFQNDTWYSAVVSIPESAYNFPNDMKLRFMCDASGNRDDVYIDDITVTGHTVLPAGHIKQQDITNTGKKVNPLFEDEYNVYPNPVTHTLNIMLEEKENAEVQLFNTSGQMVVSQLIRDGQESIDVSRIDPGIYILRITADDEVFTQKIIKN